MCDERIARFTRASKVEQGPAKASDSEVANIPEKANEDLNPSPWIGIDAGHRW